MEVVTTATSVRLWMTVRDMRGHLRRLELMPALITEVLKQLINEMPLILPYADA
jgi:hypothetical protein